MEISSSRSPECTPNNLNEVIDTAGILGIDKVACGYGPDNFETIDAIKQTADEVNAMQQKLASAGIALFQHNHEWEFNRIDGKLAYEHYLKLCPSLKIELDTYWSANYEQENPAEMLSIFKNRAILLHIKDGLFEKERTMTAVGSGKMNFNETLKEMNYYITQWLVVELDNC
ncbi:MAG: sugar phosphate isomerase/epimerase [Lentisphaerae bacterium]|nr:sugar phosphate isomerase/epimerase [Lentisphaerota bacterium]MCP4099953.1 sugar phosphate isomerase/epimerase [Lentisphaerota bacterium]